MGTISVIIPVYRVEPYLRQCLDSVTGQTYRDLEILLVDDGSPDGCGAICDWYAERDERIRVIHQENRGLSAARNAALMAATGDYIGFVDSDDWIEPEMYEYLLQALQSGNAQIAVCGRWEEFRDHQTRRGWESPRQLTSRQALTQLLEDAQMQNYVWDKLYRRELFQSIRFPEGKVYEDIEVQYRLLMKAERIVCLAEAFYHYRFRPESIANDLSLETRFYRFSASLKRKKKLEREYPELSSLLELQCLICAAPIWSAYYANPKSEREKYAGRIQKIAKFVRKSKRLGKKAGEAGRATKILLYLMPYTSWWSFAAARAVGFLYQWKNGRNL